VADLQHRRKIVRFVKTMESALTERGGEQAISRDRKRKVKRTDLKVGHYKE